MDCSSDRCPNCGETGGVYMIATTALDSYLCTKCDTRFSPFMLYAQRRTGINEVSTGHANTRHDDEHDGEGRRII